jgi:hypothetical protein
MFYERDGASKSFVAVKGFVPISIDMADAAYKHFRRAGLSGTAFRRQATHQRRGTADRGQHGEAAGAIAKALIGKPG